MKTLAAFVAGCGVASVVGSYAIREGWAAGSATHSLDKAEQGCVPEGAHTTGLMLADGVPLIHLGSEDSGHWDAFIVADYEGRWELWSAEDGWACKRGEGDLLQVSGDAGVVE